MMMEGVKKRRNKGMKKDKKRKSLSFFFLLFPAFFSLFRFLFYWYFSSF